MVLTVIMKGVWSSYWGFMLTLQINLFDTTLWWSHLTDYIFDIDQSE